jgi:hypothetical protein
MKKLIYIFFLFTIFIIASCQSCTTTSYVPSKIEYVSADTVTINILYSNYALKENIDTVDVQDIVIQKDIKPIEIDTTFINNNIQRAIVIKRDNTNLSKKKSFIVIFNE